MSFSLLTKEKQTDAALKGTFLDVRVDGTYIILLFCLGGFYVEMYYASIPNKVEKFVAFTSTTLLDPWLTELSLAEDGILQENMFGERLNGNQA